MVALRIDVLSARDPVARSDQQQALLLCTVVLGERGDHELAAVAVVAFTEEGDADRVVEVMATGGHRDADVLQPDVVVPPCQSDPQSGLGPT